ncbi:MAG: putative dibenzothiophene desulfurization enzyme [Gammaproteobacteria bacterium]|nr:putative dibenzothiophene desulfurization enzyme [Gammaproteobacteria bacterium]
MAMPPQMTALHELWHARCPVPTPLSLAVQLGWIENALPNSFRHGGSVPAIWARANGQQTRVIGLSWTDEYQAVISMPRAGITTAGQLRGRPIGIPRHDVTIDHSRAAALRAFSAILATEGLSLDDVELVDLPDHQIPSVTRDGAVIATGNGRRGRYRYTSEVHALARGDVDAVYVKDISGAQATHLLGAMIIGNIGFHPDRYVRINNGTPRPLTVSQYLLDHHPDLVRGLLTQVVLAGEWACSNRDATIAMVARETGWAESWVRYGYGDDVHENLRLDLSPSWVTALDTFKDFLAARGFLAGNFDIDDWVDPAPLRDVLDRLQQPTATSGRREPKYSAFPTQPGIYH